MTITEARDEINTLFRDAWLADALTQKLPLLYDDHADTKPRSDASWARITIRHSNSKQRTLNRPGLRRFTRMGITLVQVFSSSGKGLSTLDLLANVASKALEGKKTPGGIWFRDVSVQEVGHTGPWFQANISGTFEYDEYR